MKAFVRNSRTFMALLEKDLKLLFSNVTARILDCISPLTAQILTFGYFFPLMGVAHTKIGGMFVGSMLGLFMQLGFSILMRTLIDIENDHYINYLVTLPIPKRWLIAEFITSMAIEFMIIIFPLFLFGINFMPVSFEIKPIPLFLMMITSTIFFASLFLAFCFLFTFQYASDNLWPRFLNPLWWLGAGIFTWAQVYEFWPMLGYLFLLNPITYVFEGLRSSVLPGNHFINIYYCLGMLIIFITINCMLIMRGFKKKLDPI